MANEIGRLAQGVGNKIDGTYTIQFIKKHDLPPGATITYARIVAGYRPLKSVPNRTGLAIGV